jgi:reactive intermediate/imine deaminase
MLFACVLLFAAVEAKKSVIKVPGWPDLTAKFPLSPGIVANGVIYASGMQGLDFKKMKLVEGGVAAQTTQALTLISQVIEAGGGSMEDVVDCAVYFLHQEDFAAINEAYAKFFPKTEPPARIAMTVAGLAGGALVEIKCTGVVSDQQEIHV